MRRFLPILAAAVASAQQMPESTRPGPHHKQLDPLAGTWDVAVRFRVGPGPERESRATCVAKWILGGRFLEQTYTNKESGLEVLQIVGYDNQKKRFVEDKMDNMDTGILHTEGNISEDGKVITKVGDRTDPVSGKTARLRTVTTIADADHFTIEWYLTMPDGAEQKTVTMVHTRSGR